MSMLSARAVRRCGAAWLRVVAIGGLTALSFLAAMSGRSIAQKSEEKSWQGTWNNRARGTSGPLKCTATPTDDKTWDAQFNGMFMGRRFNHKVKIDATKKSDRTLLDGTATINGDTYRWSGYVSGCVLYGRFRSGSGNNGDFKLQQD